jgi:hypothetical protein
LTKTAEALRCAPVRMNNCYQDYGVCNADDMVELLGG